METKKTSNRGRPKKDYGELKNKIAKEAAENKGKLGRGRPKKQRTIDDSINTKISNHHKDVSILEKKNKEIHENIKSSNVLSNVSKKLEEKTERYSKIALICSIVFFVFAIGYYYFMSYQQRHNYLEFSEINSTDSIDSSSENNITQMQAGYNDENGSFVETENIEINNNIEQNGEDWTRNNYGDIKINGGETNIVIKSDNISNSDIDLIKLFYDEINNRQYDKLSKITDRYLKESNSYRTYFNANRLNSFLDKITGNKMYIGGFYERSSDKPNVKHYGYIVKYKLDNESALRQEDRDIAIVERNGEKLIGSIMCITTGCSRMPFFQK